MSLSNMVNSYQKIKSFEKNGKFYEALGIKIWNKYYPNGGSKFSLSGGMYASVTKDLPRRTALKTFIDDAKRQERKHMFFAPFFLLGFGASIGLDLDVLVTSIAAAGTVLSSYTMMASRYNRNRVEKLQDKYLK